MKHYRVNKIHTNSIIEECTRLNIECENQQQCKEILEKNGFEVIEIIELSEYGGTAKVKA